MIENIIQNNGLNIALSGISVVFFGLVLIAITIYLFNIFFQEGFFQRFIKTDILKNNKGSSGIDMASVEEIPDDELVAIAAAVECYRRIHFDLLQSEVTFARSDTRSAWKIRNTIGQSPIKLR